MPEVKPSEFEQLKAEVRKEARSRIATSLVAAAFILVLGAITGWWLYLKTFLPEIVGAVPSGAVVAFDLPKGCPNGWEKFTYAHGKVIIGAGSDSKLSVRQYREEGGKEMVSLSEPQMPEHFHPFSGTSYGIGAQDLGQAYTSSLALGKSRIGGNLYTPEGRVGPSGKGESHENMPPFIALHYCVKQ